MAEISEETRMARANLQRAESIVDLRQGELAAARKVIAEGRGLVEDAIRERRRARKLWFEMPAAERVALCEEKQCSTRS